MTLYLKLLIYTFAIIFNFFLLLRLSLEKYHPRFEFPFELSGYFIEYCSYALFAWGVAGFVTAIIQQ